MASETTLYERWRQVARDRRGEWALVDDGGSRRWTFGELAAEAEAGGGGGFDGTDGGAPVAFPQGSDSAFVLAVLRAWRRGQLVCPMDPGQPPPCGPWPSAPVVHLKTTSATTGPSRLIAFTAEQLAADAAHVVATMGLRPEWPNLGVIPLAHSYGFSNLVTPLLLHGIPLILGISSLPESVRLAARRVGVDLTVPAVPALWRAWHEAGAVPPRVRLAISAGAPLPGALERAVFDATGVKIHNFYGASECGGIAYDATAQPREDSSLAGTPLRGVTVEVTAEGCPVIRGPNVGTGYWPDADPVLAEGAYRARDLVEVREGSVFLLGRAGDVINVAGRKVTPEAVERVLLAHPSVREALVLGLPVGGGRGETIAAVVVPGAAVAEAELRRFLLERLPAWQVPRYWRFEESGLSNARGKVARARWRHAFP